MRKWIGFSTLLALAACAQPNWVPMRQDVRPVEQARSTCRFEAERAMPSFDLRRSALETAFGQLEIFNACMDAQGYRRG